VDSLVEAAGGWWATGSEASRSPFLSTSTPTMFLHALRGVRSGLPKLRSPFPFFLPEPVVKITVICKNNFHKQFVFFPPNIFAFYFGFTFFFSISSS
jgi:hypothetical protein